MFVDVGEVAAMDWGHPDGPDRAMLDVLREKLQPLLKILADLGVARSLAPSH